VATEIDARKSQSAVYIMQNFEGERWSGNFGLRFARTQVTPTSSPLPAGVCPKSNPGKPVTPCAAVPDAINTAGDGSTFYDGTVFNPLQGTGLLEDAEPPHLQRPAAEPEPALRTGQGHDRALRRQPHHRPPELQHLGASFGTPGLHAPAAA
jgi:hypothetical protein